MSAAIRLNNLRVVFQDRGQEVVALNDLCLEVPAGSVFGFLGPNGAGKTTTMHVLLGYVEPTAGEAFIFEADVRESIARARIGYLPEHPQLYPFLTGREMLHITGKLFNLRKEELRERADKLLSDLGISAAGDRRIGTYSRGMMQRLGLAQALINDPDLVILDEPTSGLDPLGRKDIREIVSELKQAGKTVFFSSHELSEAELVCDQLAIVSRGRIAASGAAEDLVKTAENLEHYFLGVIQGEHDAV